MLWTILLARYLWSRYAPSTPTGTRPASTGMSGGSLGSPTGRSVPERSSSLCRPIIQRGSGVVKAGSDVVYLARPEWGVGRVRWVAPNGLLMVRFEEAQPVYEGEFAEAELESLETWAAAA